MERRERGDILDLGEHRLPRVPATFPHQLLRDSRARCEGNTLVAETT